MDVMDPLDLGLPEGPVPWWEVRAEFPDGDAPWPPPSYPQGVEAVHCARLTVVRLQAGSASGALARVEEILGAAGGRWTVSPLRPVDVIASR